MLLKAGRIPTHWIKEQEESVVDGCWQRPTNRRRPSQIKHKYFLNESNHWCMGKFVDRWFINKIHSSNVINI